MVNEKKTLRYKNVSISKSISAPNKLLFCMEIRWLCTHTHTTHIYIYIYIYEARMRRSYDDKISANMDIPNHWGPSTATLMEEIAWIARETMLKKKTYLIPFHGRTLVSQLTFQICLKDLEYAVWISSRDVRLPKTGCPG